MKNCQEASLVYNISTKRNKKDGYRQRNVHQFLQSA